MVSIAVIPARSGSKRISQKNIRPFIGKPLIAWTILAAIESECFDHVFVSTDSGEIADIAAGFGADVPFLRESLFDDFSPVSLATLDMAERVEVLLDEPLEFVTQLLPVCPLRTGDQVRDVVDFFRSQGGSDSIISASAFAFHPPWWAATLDEHCVPTYLHPEGLKKRSQDLQEAVAPNGAVWISTYARLRESGTFYSDRHRLFEIPWGPGLDIDSELDFAIAELVGKGLFPPNLDT